MNLECEKCNGSLNDNPFSKDLYLSQDIGFCDKCLLVHNLNSNEKKFKNKIHYRFPSSLFNQSSGRLLLIGVFLLMIGFLQDNSIELKILIVVAICVIIPFYLIGKTLEVTNDSLIIYHQLLPFIQKKFLLSDVSALYVLDEKFYYKYEGKTNAYSLFLVLKNEKVIKLIGPFFSYEELLAIRNKLVK